MSASTLNKRVTCLCIIALAAVSSLASASDQDKNSLKIAVVNPGRLLREYKYSKQAEEDLTRKKNDIVTAMNSWNQHGYLPEADQSALGDIAIKESNKVDLSATEKATKARLEDTTKRLFDEYLALQTRQNATPEDQARLKELTRLDQDTKKRITDRQTRAREELQKQTDDAQQKIDADVRVAIQEVAKAKGYNMVFSSEVLLYCDTDITDDVLKKLNK